MTDTDPQPPDPLDESPADEANTGGLPLTGGVPPADDAARAADDADTGEPFTQIAPPT